MKYLNPLGSQESVADSSSSDAASQTSSESPAGDWSLGLPSSWSDNKADDPWQWMDLDKLGVASLSLAGQTIPAQNAFSQLAPEPMILNFDDAFLYQQQQAMIQQQPLFPPSASPADILGSSATLPTSNTLPQPPLPSFESLAQLQQLSALMQNSIPQPITQQLQTVQPLQAPNSGAAGEADDIAAKARALAGVTAAISQPKPGTLPSNLLTPDVMQAYLAAASAAAHSTQFAPATPSPISTASTSPAPSSPPSSEQAAPDVVIGSSGRPKTSHTTIERRYRTNLNARITALRHAVPALRILDKDQFPDEVVDEKGYVDGVKAARKASKASVLGKAAEYIHVLKRRETRLRKEVQGLRALVSGLIGGPLLLKEWEKGWKERYGDEEREEAEAESDVGDEDSEDEDDKPRKKPKVVTPPKPPVIAPKEKKSPSQVTNPIVPETGKRKRGRPRKIQANGSEDSLAPLPIAPQVTTFQANPQQPQILAPAVDPTALFGHHTTHEQPNATYLLGVFLFFSFFKPSPDGAASSSPVHHAHTGSVLSSLSSSKLSRTVQATTSSPVPLVGIPWSTALHHLHTVMSIVLILSLVVPFLPSPRSLFGRSSKAGSKVEDDSEDLTEERTRLSKVLRTRGLIWEAILASLGSLKAKIGFARSNSGELSETEVIEREAWRKLAVVELMLAPTLPFVNHFTKVLAIWNRQPTSPTFVDLSTLAFLVRPFSASFANQLWAKAQALVKKSSVSHRAAHSLRLDFSQAVEMFDQAAVSGFAVLDDDESVNSPIEMVTDVLLLETVKALLGKMFIKTTESHLPTSLSDMDHLTASVSTLQSAPEHLYRDDAEMSELAEYVLVIGEGSRGQVADILKLWEKLWKEQADDEILAELESEEEDEEDEEYSELTCPLVRETRDLIRALVLLRKVLFSSMVSDSSSTSTCSPTRSASMTPTSSSTCLALSSLPPPSPSPTLANFPHFPPSSTSTLKLRQALAASVFDEDEEIEEARDAVVDMLCNDRLTMRRSRFH